MDVNVNAVTVAVIYYGKNLINQLNEILDDDDDDSSEDEVDDILFSAVYESHQNKIAKIALYVERVVLNYSELQFKENFRMSRTSFESLLMEIQQIQETEAAVGCPQIDLQKQLLAVIWILATPDSYRSVSERFGISKGGLSKAFIRIINFINQLAPKYIIWPTGTKLVEVKSTFKQTSPFTNLIGVIDGTYVPIKAPRNQMRSYTNRKCFNSITLQAVCDNDMRFTDIYTGWPSSVPDIRIFKNSTLYIESEPSTNTNFPNGEYILGDKAYPPLIWCIPPYIRRRITSREVRFNKIHASTRQIIERSFALLFGRFRRLRLLDMNRTDWIPSTILACCVLHNVCINCSEDNQSFICEGEAARLQNEILHDNARDSVANIQTDGILKRNIICRNILINTEG